MLKIANIQPVFWSGWVYFCESWQSSYNIAYSYLTEMGLNVFYNCVTSFIDDFYDKQKIKIK